MSDDPTLASQPVPCQGDGTMSFDDFVSLCIAIAIGILLVLGIVAIPVAIGTIYCWIAGGC